MMSSPDKNQSIPMLDVLSETSHSEIGEKEAMKVVTRFLGDIETKVADWKGGVNGAEGRDSF